MIHGKVYRFIFVETLFRSRFFIFLVITAVALLEIIALMIINKKINEGEVRKALIGQVSEMESILYPGGSQRSMINTRPAEPIKISGKLYALKGVNQLDGKLSALINEDVYQEGDTINDYRIAKITADSVLFKHIKTDELKVLRFGY